MTTVNVSNIEPDNDIKWGPRVVSDDDWIDDHSSECVSWAKDYTVSFDAVLKAALETSPLIAADPEVVLGAPRIAGTRIPVYMVLDAIGFYGTTEDVLKSYPQLTSDQVAAAIAFAALVLEQPRDHETQE